VIDDALRNARHGGARILRAAARLLDQSPAAGDSTSLAQHANRMAQSASKHDMLAHSDEPYYADQYVHWIVEEAHHLLSQPRARILDLGCGQGRLSLRLAGLSSDLEVRGVDLSTNAVNQARQYAAAQNISNVEFIVGDALDFVRAQPDADCDVAVVTELCFYFPRYRELLADLYRILKRGGCLAVSFRSQYFNLLHWVRQREWDDVDRICKDREGLLESSWFSWQTPDDIRQLLAEVGFPDVRIRGIGICSGIEGDPLSHIARPSDLWPEEKSRLRSVETALAEQYAACGRYILALAVRPHDQN
jgi:ubiquinone/menaquinone biosynthesis C-methylase UbiE